MQIADMKIPVCEIVKGYTDDGDAGCFVYDGKCCARPSYQRNFCYGDKERNAVIKTVSRGLRLGVMY